MRHDQSVLNSLSLSGLAATLVGNGIGRFAYIALMPVLIQQMWFTRTEAASLGAATLLGYLLGVPLTDRLARRVSPQFLLRTGLIMCSLSYLACAWQGGGFVWFYFWRLLAGVGGAAAMVLAPNMVLIDTPASRRGRVIGVVFSGIGLGAMASGTVVPLFLGFGLAEVWLLLGSICVLLTALTWKQWQENVPNMRSKFRHNCTTGVNLSPGCVIPVGLLLVAYVLNAVGYLPHTLFWVDYIARELCQPIALAGFLWAVFGIGAAVGPFVTGSLADRFGFSKTLVAAFLLKAVGVALPLADTTGPSLFVSSILVGMFTPGIAALVSGYTMALVGVATHHRVWGLMTGCFAASQVGAGYVMVFMMTTRESYHIVFAISALALLAASICVAAVRQPVKCAAFSSADGQVA